MALAFYAAAFSLVRARTAGAREHAEVMPLGELFRVLATSRERADPNLIAASLLFEMRRESRGSAFAGARDRLARGAHI